MISTRRTLLSVLLTVATFCVAAAQQTNVFYPAFPVLAGRSHNIVSEICIDGNIIGKTNRDEIQNQMRLKFARKLQKRNVTEKSHTSYSQKWLSNVN